MMSTLCSEYAQTIHTACVRMQSDASPTGEPRWGWILVVVVALALILTVDVITTTKPRTFRKDGRRSWK
jgi:hypothetical protein